MNLADALVPKTYARGERIIKQGKLNFPHIQHCANVYRERSISTAGSHQRPTTTDKKENAQRYIFTLQNISIPIYLYISYFILS